jgi:AcrR family transcriptional regulator
VDAGSREENASIQQIGASILIPSAPIRFQRRVASVALQQFLDIFWSECLLTNMSTLRMTSDLRRQLILGAAKRCFARHGFAGTTTKSVAAAASISEGLLFKHFPTKSALYAEILAEECAADPALHRLLELAPSTETLVVLIRDMVRHFQEVAEAPDLQEAQRLRLMLTSHLDDGEFARLIYEKIADLIGPAFTASLERAVAAGDAARIGREPLNLFWFAHHTVLMATLTRLPSAPCLSYGDAADLDPVQWGKPARPANDASDDAISEKQPADKPGQPAERSTH